MQKVYKNCQTGHEQVSVQTTIRCLILIKSRLFVFSCNGTSAADYTLPVRKCESTFFESASSTDYQRCKCNLFSRAGFEKNIKHTK